MTVHREEHLEACAESVLGQLTGEAAAEFEAHLAAGCAVCEAELRVLSGGMLVLALACAPQAADAALRERVLASARGEAAPATTAAPPSPRARPRAGAWGFAGVLLALLAWAGWRAQVRLASDLQATREQARRLGDSLQRERRWSELLHGAATRVIALTPTPEGDPSLAARVFLDRGERRAVVVADHLPARAGRDLELWAVTPSGARSLGLLASGEGGRSAARLDSIAGLAEIDAFAVSDEAVGGSRDPRQPHGPFVLLGRLPK